MATYTVELDAFHGPLDLLLYLVRRDEVDIRDVSMVALADQFLSFLAAAQALDVDLAGEFVVVAATLLEIKARSLLPTPATVTAESVAAGAAPDPRRDLVRQLLDYREFKDAAARLEQQADRHATRVARTPPLEAASPTAVPVLRPVEVWDVVSAFARLLRETELAPAATLQVEDTPQHIHEAHIRAAVQNGRVNLRDLFTPPHTRERLIGLFLALLELVKTQAVRLEQTEPFADLWVCPPGSAPGLN